MTETTATSINGSKGDNTIAGLSTDESAQTGGIVSEAKPTVMDLHEKKEKRRKLDAGDKKFIAKAKLEGNSYAKSTKFIHEHINIVMEVAEHLHIIRDYRLYRLHYNTFEEYVEEEFNYTRSRAYQLTRAYHIAEYINKELGQAVLTTEPQCRELLRLRVYKDDEHEDKQQTQEARLALVKKILEEDKTAKASLIAEEVDRELKAVQAKRVQEKSIERYRSEIQSTVARIQKKITDIISSKTLPKDEVDNIKVIAKQYLMNILESLK